MKKIVLFASLLVSIATWGEITLTGTVKTDTQSPIANAVVSDGYSVVKTAEDGTYSMPYNPSATFVFVSVPSGYDFPTDETGFPKIWQRIDKTSNSHIHSFTLHQQEDGGKADSSHVLLVIGDPQVLNAYDMWRFQSETVEDIKALKASYPQGTKFIGLTVGDIVWDEYGYFDDQKSIYNTMGIANFMTIGNHDHNCKAAKQPTQAAQDSVASLQYEAIFGPTYYSFNVGAMHYVVLDNVFYKGYNGGGKGYDCQLTDKQKKWVAQDIAQLQKGTQVVYAMHIIGTNNGTDLIYLQNLVDSLSYTNYIMSGHVHTNTVTVQRNNFVEHNVAACQGSFWCSDWCADGSPNGYKVFETSPKGIANWYYKGTGWNEDFRIATYPVGSINAGNNKQNYVLANIWDYDKYSTVKILEDGIEYKMTKFTADGTDPDAYDIMLDDGDTRPNYPGSEGGTIADKNPGSQYTRHLFSYKPKATNSSMEVVFTDQFGKVTTAPILRHMMVASFQQIDSNSWVYQQDFNHLPSYPNYVATERRGTWVAGHTPKGWYACTSNSVLPGEGTVSWSGYDWLQIDNGKQNKAWLKSYGSISNIYAQNGKERSLGSLNLSTQKRICYGVIIENNTGNTIRSLNVSYTGEVWRIGSDNTAKEHLNVSYAVLADEEARQIRDRETWIGAIATAQAPQLQFTTPDQITAKQTHSTNAEMDGNLAQNQAKVQGTINVTIEPGQVVLIRWDDDLVTDDKDQALAIDDVCIIPSTITAIPKLNTDLPNVDARKFWYNGEFLIQTDNEIYTITGQKR